MKRIMQKKIACYIRDARGAILVLFAVMAPVLVGAAGMALDFSGAYLVQQRLAQALDASALAAASSSTDANVIKKKVQDFFQKNYPPEKTGFTITPVVTVTNDEVKVTGQANYQTLFLSVLGIKDIAVSGTTTVKRDVRGLEVALVLDNTGSMADYDKIGALKTASTNFVNILYSHTSDASAVKIGLVPYANAVRIGKFGMGKNLDGSIYNGGKVFVTLPSDVTHTSNHNASSGWYGCVVEHNPNNYNSSATYVDGSKGQLWKSGSSWNGHGWNPAITTNDPSPHDTIDNWRGPWDIYQYGTISTGSCAQSQQQCTKTTQQCVASHQQCTAYYTSGSKKGQCKTYTTVCDQYQTVCTQYQTVCVEYNYSFTANSQPNVNCPYTNILPLTSDKALLLSQIQTMQAHGNTLGNVGTLWGYRLLSPEEPFTEGVEWTNERWHKAVVIMTDGINTRDSVYSNFWASAKNQLNTTHYNDRFLEVCNALKDHGVTVYTIILGTNGRGEDPDANTKNYYKKCASSEAQYYDAPTNDELIGVFEEISRQLSNLYISE